MSSICEYCNSLYSGKNAIKSYIKRVKYCDNLSHCDKGEEREYNLSNDKCISYGKSIFVEIIAKIGDTPFIEASHAIKISKNKGLITSEDSVKFLANLNELIRKYYEYIDNVVYKTIGVDISSGKEFSIKTPLQWATVIRTVQKTANNIRLSIIDAIEGRSNDIKGKETYCNQKSVKDCSFPCKKNFLGNKCLYETPKLDNKNAHMIDHIPNMINKEKEKPNHKCTTYARNIFEAIILEIGTTLFIQSENVINSYRQSGLITLEDSIEFLIKLDESVENYYKYVDSVVLKNEVVLGKKIKLETSEQWAYTIITIQKMANDIKSSTIEIVETRNKDIKRKESYCNRKSIKECVFPCKKGVLGQKCVYEQPNSKSNFINRLFKK